MNGTTCTLAEHYAIITKRTGRHPLGVLLECPEEFLYLAEIAIKFLKTGNLIDFPAVLAWSQLTGMWLTNKELEVIMKLSNIYFKVHSND